MKGKEIMIKGTNKQVLEVTNTENPYFEKIIFFVKPEYVNAGGEKLKKEAQIFAKKATKPPRARRTKREIRYICLQSALCVGAGIAITFLLNYFT